MTTPGAFDEAVAAQQDDDDGGDDDVTWYLKLYVAGDSPKSLQAYANLKRLCETHIDHPYEIEIIDLLENPGLARGDEILAIPTLVRRVPAPLRRIIGDLSDTDRVLVGLQVDPERSS